MTVVINYGLGNLRSVVAAVKRLGQSVFISDRIGDLEKADKLILPGVGAFGDGMFNLKKLGLIEGLNRIVLKEKKPILGICLGSQLMAKESYEFGYHQGLGWIDASVLKLDVKDMGLRIPHVGWNGFIQKKDSILFDGINEDSLFYYAHSFYTQCKRDNIVIAECDYGKRFTAVFNQDNIYATQFHPEKSQLPGLNVLKNFLNKT